ncbi:ABC transporter substrate-binding protein [Aneurinibacillus tyrosinisolvens]|uniref:ABC transporter substrate-binding protein n=1 Tax=Aneurinibacillus tyrosinisolvens TaxID=1443435 RepID=UPI00069950E1|nr:ABC transporter substrate-binding protein [Aneurinibacillus tyrosinisolvens]
MKNKMLLLFVVILVAFGGVAGCGGTAKEPSGAKKPTADSPPSASNAFPLTIKDSTGKEVKIDKEPQKIVSVMPSTTEIAFALGLGDKVVGVSNYDDYPKEAAAKKKVGDLNVSIEKVVSLEPDLVLADTGNGKAVDNLRKAGIPVIATEAKTLDDIYGMIEMIGKATGTSDKANDVVGKMKEDVKQVEEKVKSVPADKKPKVWVEVDSKLYTAGKGTFINDMIAMAGGENIASDVDGWKQLSEEKIIERSLMSFLIRMVFMIRMRRKKSKPVLNGKT